MISFHLFFIRTRANKSVNRMHSEIVSLHIMLKVIAMKMPMQFSRVFLYCSWCAIHWNDNFHCNLIRTVLLFYYFCLIIKSVKLKANNHYSYRTKWKIVYEVIFPSFSFNFQQATKTYATQASFDVKVSILRMWSRHGCLFV